MCVYIYIYQHGSMRSLQLCHPSNPLNSHAILNPATSSTSFTSPMDPTLSAERETWGMNWRAILCLLEVWSGSTGIDIWGYPEIGVPPNHPLYWDIPWNKSFICGFPHFQETPIWNSVARKGRVCSTKHLDVPGTFEWQCWRSWACAKIAKSGESKLNGMDKCDLGLEDSCLHIEMHVYM